MEQLINKLKTRLGQALPGIEAQYKMAPFNRERINLNVEDTSSYRKSAVMIILYQNEANEWCIPLTERVNYGGIHSGQISFPGGKYEHEDQDLLNTALRECYEEIGIKEIDTLGSLTHLYIPVSMFLVQPYIGIIKNKMPVFKPQAREVEKILNLELSYLLNDKNVLNGEIAVNEGLKIKSPYFEVETKKIWGATAMILSELKEVLKTIS